MNKLILILLITSTPLFADNCDDILTATEISLVSGNDIGAVEIIEQSDCFQDFAFVMNAGHLFYKHELYNEAVKQYEIAVELSDGNKDALLLLGWSEFYLANYWVSLKHFKEVLEIDDENESALYGISLASAAKSSKNSVGNFLTKHVYISDFYKNSAIGLTSNIYFSTCPGTVVGVTRRRTVFDVNTPAELGYADSNSPSTMSQEEYWWSVANYGRDGSLKVVGGQYENDSNWNEKGSLLGIEVSKSFYKMSAVISDYDDGMYSQYNVGSSVLTGPNSSASFFLSCQDASRKPVWSVGASLHYGLRSWIVDFAARGGCEVRPVYIDELSVYNVKQEIRGSSSVAISRELSFGLLTFAGEFQKTYSHEMTVWQFDSFDYKTVPASEGNLWLLTFGLTYEM